MGFQGCLLILMLLMILNKEQNTLLANPSLKNLGPCPTFKVKCHFRESDSCYADLDCRPPERCCLFSCGLKCIDPNGNLCGRIDVMEDCPHTLTRWYFSSQDDECFPFEYSLCTNTRNSFQTRTVCRMYCFQHRTMRNKISF